MRFLFGYLKTCTLKSSKGHAIYRHSISLEIFAQAAATKLEHTSEYLCWFFSSTF